MRRPSLSELLADPSPFYGSRLAAKPDRIPLTRRRELIDDQLAHPPLGSRRPGAAADPVRVGVTGTGDDLLVLAWSAADLARERAAGARLLGGLGIAPGMRVANVLPGALATPGSLLLGDVIEEMGCLDVPLGTVGGEPAAREAWALLERAQPDVIVCDAASGPTLLASAPEPPPSWWRGVVWLGCDAGAWPRVRGWQRRWLAVPEASSFVAGSCAAGMLHPDDGVLVEVTDESGAPRPAGEWGTLALTPLGGDTRLFRYAPGIAARVVPGPCGCGRAGAMEVR
jgi:hypothetical protein